MPKVRWVISYVANFIGFPAVHIYVYIPCIFYLSKSEYTMLRLVKSKCLPVLLYCLEVCQLTKTDLKSLYFVINWFFMKLFRTSDIETVKKTCHLQFWFDLPSVIIEERTKNLKKVSLKLKQSMCF